MTNKRYSEIEKKAKETTDKIKKCIEGAKDENYSYAALVMQQLFKVISEDKETGAGQLNDIIFEMNIEHNIKSFKVESLDEEMKLEKFLHTLIPYYNDQQARILF